MKIDLEEKDLVMVTQILQKSLHDLNAAVYVFGSRVTGSAKRYSDLDLLIDCNHEKMPFKTGIKLAIDFEDSVLPFKVDIVDANDITKTFKDLITKDLVKLM